MQYYRRQARIMPASEAVQRKRDQSDETLFVFARLIIAILSTIITPIIIGIIQDIHYGNVVCVIGLFCDIYSFLEVCYLMQSNCINIWSETHHNKVPTPYVILVSIAALPLVIVPIRLGSEVSGYRLSWVCVARMIRVTDIRTCFLLIKQSKYMMFLRNDTVSRLVLIFVYSSIYTSFLACVWFYISSQGLHDDTQLPYWILYDAYLNRNSYSSRYFRSLYYVMQTIFTIGFGDTISIHINNKEILFTLFLILNGSLFYGFLISSITSMLFNKDVTSKQYRNDLMILHKCMNMLQISTTLADRIDQLYSFLYTRQCGVMPQNVLKTIPMALQNEIKLNYSQLLKNVPFFSNECDKFVTICTELLTYRTYVPGAIVFFQNERNRELLLIKSGRIEMRVHTSRNALFSLMAGDNVGEFQLLFGGSFEVMAQASSFTEVMVLSFENFIHGVNRYNDGREISLEDWLASRKSSVSKAVANHKKYREKIVKVRTSMEINQSKRRMIDMMRSNTFEPVRFIIYPDSIVKCFISGFVAIGIFYYLMTIPTRTALSWTTCGGTHSKKHCLSEWTYSLIFDYIFDIALVADTVLHAGIYAYKEFDGDKEMQVTNRRLIFDRFRRSKRSLYGILAVIPLDLFAISFGYILAFRASKLISGFLLFEAIDEVLSTYELRYKKSLLSNEGVTVLYLSIITVVVCAWVSSVWSMLSKGDSSLLEGLYWCLTVMTTVGYGDIKPHTTLQTMYATLICIVGPCTCATIIANAASFVGSLNTNDDSMTHRKVVFETFFRGSLFTRHSKSQINSSKSLLHNEYIESRRENKNSCKEDVLEDQVMSYFDHMLKHRGGIDDAKLLQQVLPDYLCSDIQQHVALNAVLTCNLFAKCESGVLRDIMLALEFQYYSKDSVIVQSIYIPGGMYFIHSGLVQLQTAQLRKTTKYSHGDTFAEIFLFENSLVCNFNATAFHDCEVWYLSKTKFQSVLKAYEVSKESINGMKNISVEMSKRIFEVTNIQPNLRALQMMHEYGAQDGDSWIVKPNTMNYHLWQVALIFSILYNAVFIPPLIAFFHFNHSALLTLIQTLNIFSDIIYFTDILLCMLVFAFVENNNFVVLREKMCKNYITKKVFIVHVLASLPMDAFALLIMQSQNGYQALSMLQIIGLLRVNKLLRLVDINRLVTCVEEYFFLLWNSTMMNIWKVLKLMTVVYLTAHIIGSLFFFIAYNEHLIGDYNWAYDSGILKECLFGAAVFEVMPRCDSGIDHRLIVKQYVTSVYWAVATLTTVGYGDVTPITSHEQIVTIIVFIIGTGIYTMVISCLQGIVCQLDVTSDIFKSRKDRIKVLLLRERVSNELLIKSKQYMDTMWVVLKGAQPEELKEFLPNHIYTTFVLSTLGDKLDNSAFMKSCPHGFRMDIAASMEMHMYMSPDFIFHTGEAAQTLYIMLQGEVQLVNEESGQKYSKIFSSEGVIGEYEFFYQCCYSCGAQVGSEASTVMLYELTYESFIRLAETHNLLSSFATQLYSLHRKTVKSSTEAVVLKLKENLKNSKMTKMVYFDASPTNSHPLVILPNSYFAKMWMFLSVVLIAYIALTVPYYIAFNQINYSIAILDSIVFTFFTIEIYLKLRYFAAESNGVLVTIPSQFSSLYMRSGLRWDLITILPVALLVYGTSQNKYLFACTRALYFMRLRGAGKRVHRVLTAIEFEVGAKVPADYLRVIEIVVIVWYFGHIATCLFCFLGNNEHLFASTESSWIILNQFSNLSCLDVYLRGYLWAMYSIITVGYGVFATESTVEMLFAIFVMIVGAILCDAGVVAVLSSIISNMDKQSSTIRRSMEAIQQFCISNQYNDSIKNKVNAYFHYLSSELNNTVEADDFNFLPKPLMLEFVQFSSFEALCSLCLLDTKSQDIRLGFVYSLIRLAVPTIALPQQVILGMGDSNVHILRRGKAYARINDGTQRRDYYQAGEALCRDGRLNTVVEATSPGKIINVTVDSVHIMESDSSIASRFISSQMHARLICGARKARTATKGHVHGQYDAEWNEKFQFHAPNAVNRLDVLLFDEKLAKDDGFVGKATINLEELSKSSVLQRNTDSKPNAVKTQKDKADQDDELDDMCTVGEDSTIDMDAGLSECNYIEYELKQELRDKNGLLKGWLKLKINVKQSGVSSAGDIRRQSYFRNESEVVVIAETYCHLLTIEGCKLRRLKKFYRNYLQKENDDKGISSHIEKLIGRQRRPSSFSLNSFADAFRSKTGFHFRKNEKCEVIQRTPWKEGEDDSQHSQCGGDDDGGNIVAVRECGNDPNGDITDEQKATVVGVKEGRSEVDSDDDDDDDEDENYDAVAHKSDEDEGRLSMTQRELESSLGMNVFSKSSRFNKLEPRADFRLSWIATRPHS